MSDFTVFAANLEPAGLYDLLDRLGAIGAIIAGVGRDYALVELRPPGGRDPRAYEIRLDGPLAPAIFADFAVAVHAGAVETVLVGRLDQSALHGLLRLARSLGADLLALACLR